MDVGVALSNATAIFIEVVVVPTELEAVIVYVVYAWRVSGVPEIAQLVELILKPLGIVGLIVQLVGVPPLRLGVCVAIAVSFFKIIGDELYTSEVGAVDVPVLTTDM
jgi:hypothetical protein